MLAERLDVGAGQWTGRSHREAPEIDGEVTFTPSRELRVGDYAEVLVTGNQGPDLVGEQV